MFTFEPPAGYKVVHRDRTADDVCMGRSLKSGLRSTLRFIFNIDDRALLVCWAYYDDSGAEIVEPDLHEADTPDIMTVRPSSWKEPWPHRSRLLRVDLSESGKHHWRWHLYVPEGEDPVLQSGGYSFDYPAYRPRLRVIMSQLRFDREDLKRWLADAQALSLPKDAPPDAAFTLEQLEALIDEGAKD